MKENNLVKDRAWIEIDLDNLVNNISEIKKIISPKTKIMAVVKANAYGHGALLSNVRLFKDSLVEIIDDVFDCYDLIINLFGGQCQII